MRTDPWRSRAGPGPIARGFTATPINATVDGCQVFNLAGSFADGAFGCHEVSQPGVVFSNVDISPIDAQVPLPAGGWLMLTGLGAAAAVRRRARG